MLARMRNPFEAVLFVGFGGPQGRADVRPFLENVLRGRRVSPQRVEEVAHHYELFGGVSPLTEHTMQQAHALEARLAGRGIPLPVHVGMRNWHPFLADTLREMSAAGHRRAIGVLAAAHRSYSGCLQYKENVRDARRALARDGVTDVDVVYVGDWHEHPGFIDANADHVRRAIARLPPDCRDRARLIFTAHSIPQSMAAAYPYERQLLASASRVAERVVGDEDTPGARDWSLVYQSRSGRPGDPWLEPDICDYLRAEAARGLDAVVVCPIGFICDHIEVLYDLDTEAAGIAKQLGIAFQRAQSVNAHPRFIDALADAVTDVWNRYQHATPLPVEP
jgi:protoporphyrin/coproporphyrin ferrochelatase